MSITDSHNIQGILFALILITSGYIGWTLREWHYSLNDDGDDNA